MGRPTRFPLKPRAADAEAPGMRCERLVYEADDGQLCLQLHPGLTVLGGMDPAAARVLVGDLAGALLGPRPGVRADLVDEDGGPVGSLAELVDAPPDVDALVRTVRVRRAEPDTVRLRAELLLSLADADHDVVTATARAAVDAAAHLDTLHAAYAAAAAETSSIEEIGEQHGEVEDRRRTADRRRRTGLGAALLLTVGAGAAFATIGIAAAGGLLAAAIALFIVTVRTHEKVLSAMDEERRALEAAGAETALGVQLQRVNLMLQATRRSRELHAAEAAHDEAMFAWSGLAGPLDPAQVLDPDGELALMRRILAEHRESAPVLAAAVLALLDQLDDAAVDAEPLPVVIDRALDDLPSDTAISFLELVVARAHRQVVLVTGSEALLAWARDLDGNRGRVVGPADPAAVLAA